jgi:predicted dehydrogenase
MEKPKGADLTRRGFLAASGASAVQAAAASSSQIRTAIYGIGHAHARGKVQTVREMAQFELVGICEPDSNQPREHEVLRGVRWLSEEEMLRDASVELIVVESRVQENLGYAQRAVAAGKWVHLDKPPGVDLSALRELFSDAKRNGTIVQMGYQWRYHPAMQAAIEAHSQGWLGETYAVRATINKPISLETRKELAAFRGGMMFELGCHMIDRIVEVLGRPKSVTSWMRHDAPIEDTLEDNTLAVFEFDRAMAEVYVAAQQPNGGNYRTFEILGANGTATVRPFSPYRLLVDLKEAVGPYKAGFQKIEIARPPGPPFVGDFAELARVVREGEKPSYSAEHDLISHEALLKACKLI